MNSSYLSEACFLELSNTVTSRILACYQSQKQNVKLYAIDGRKKEIYFLPFLYKALKSSAQKIPVRFPKWVFISCNIQHFFQGKKEKDKLLVSPISFASQLLSDKILLCFASLFIHSVNVHWTLTVNQALCYHRLYKDK